MKTVNSLSGGKTSSYLAAHYPADVEIFALCCIDDHNAGKGIDPAIRRQVSMRLEKHSSGYGEFRATSEHPSILKTMLDLEQHIGREIVWVRGESWEQLVARRKFLPNQQMRFCTSELKIRPIFSYLFSRNLLPCAMRIGFRFDEQERAERQNPEQSFRYAHRSDIWPRRTRWEDYEGWRALEYPLINDRVGHWHVQQYWGKNPNVQFAADSNCQFCFWKQPQQLAKNYQDAPHVMRWAAVQEVCIGGQFKKEIPMLSVPRVGIQSDFMFGGGSGCQAGFCTD